MTPYFCGCKPESLEDKIKRYKYLNIEKQKALYNVAQADWTLKSIENEIAKLKPHVLAYYKDEKKI